MSGPGLVGSMNLSDRSPPVEVDPTQEHRSLVFLVADESLLLPAKILVPRPELDVGGADACWGTLGGRIPRLASEAIRDLRL